VGDQGNGHASHPFDRLFFLQRKAPGTGGRKFLLEPKAYRLPAPGRHRRTNLRDQTGLPRLR